jgi:hypothetical protein
MRPDHEAVGVEPAMMGPVWGREEVASATRGTG